MGSRTNLRQADGVQAFAQKLRIITRGIGDRDLLFHDPHYSQAAGVKFDASKLVKHPLGLIICKSKYNGWLKVFVWSAL